MEQWKSRGVIDGAKIKIAQIKDWVYNGEEEIFDQIAASIWVNGVEIDPHKGIDGKYDFDWIRKNASRLKVASIKDVKS